MCVRKFWVLLRLVCVLSCLTLLTFVCTFRLFWNPPGTLLETSLVPGFNLNPKFHDVLISETYPTAVMAGSTGPGKQVSYITYGPRVPKQSAENRRDVHVNFPKVTLHIYETRK